MVIVLRDYGAKKLVSKKQVLDNAVHLFEVDNERENVESAFLRTNWLLNHMKAIIINILNEPKVEFVQLMRRLTHKSHVFTPDILQNVSTSSNIDELYGSNDSVHKLKEAFLDFVLFMNDYLNFYTDCFFYYKMGAYDELVQVTNENYKKGLVFLKEVFEKVKTTVRQLTKRRASCSTNCDDDLDSRPTTRCRTGDDHTHHYHYTPRITKRSVSFDDSDSDDLDIRPTNRCRTDVNYVPSFAPKSTKRPAIFENDDDTRPSNRPRTDVNYIPPFAPCSKKRSAPPVTFDDYEFYNMTSKCRI